MRREDKYILHCCRFLQPDYAALEELHDQNLDYIYILGQLMFNRVGGVGWHTLANAPFLGKLNREFRNPLKAVHEAGVQKGDSFARALDLLFGIFAVIIRKRFGIIRHNNICG